MSSEFEEKLQSKWIFEYNPDNMWRKTKLFD